MKEQIIVEGIVIAIRRTKNKNAYLRIYPDTGAVVASIPRRMSEALAMKFIQGRASWLKKHLGALEKTKEASPPFPHRFQTGEKGNILGKEYTLVMVEDQRSIEILGDKLLFPLFDSPIKSAALWDEFIDFQLSKRAEAYMQMHCGRMGLPLPTWKFRKMRSRWGSCNPAKARISLNRHLWKLPEECLSYVIVHELCHLRVPNHSRDFYALMDRYCPDWAKVRRYMRGITLE